MSNSLVLYHGGCRDGFAAAWCVWRRWRHPEFKNVHYGEAPPDVAGRDVIIVDFSYPREVMEKIAADASSLLVLDHHKTAREALMDLSLPKTTILFDMERSGAGMAWDHFGLGLPRPWLVDYVEDRDLWRHKLPDSQAVNAYISTLSIEPTANNFGKWLQVSTMPVEHVARLGEVVLQKIDRDVQAGRKNARRVVFEGYEVPIVNTTSEVSELLGSLCLDAEGAWVPPFAIGWFQRRDGKFQYSLRSRGDFDVSALAKRYGGGGHKNAAGFESSTLLGL